MLTLDEIQKMRGLELDAAIGEEMDWGHDGDGYWPNVHDSLDACHEAEERLKEMCLQREYAAALRDVVAGYTIPPPKDGWRVQTTREGIFEYVHATARQRAEAILAAVQSNE